MPKIPKPNAPKRTEKLALNLFDLGRVPPIILQRLLAGNLETDRSKVVRLNEDRLDETGVILTCDLLRAATICDILRSHDRKAKDYPTRVYLRRRDSWTKVPSNRALTIVLAGKVVLNPELFGPVELDIEPIKHQPKPVQF